MDQDIALRYIIILQTHGSGSNGEREDTTQTKFEMGGMSVTLTERCHTCASLKLGTLI